MRIGKIKVNHYINYAVIGLLTLVFSLISLTGGRMDSSLLFLLEKTAISIILAVSLSMVVGFLGELSLGHAGFMCVGAYLGGKVAVLLEPALGNGPLTLLIALVVGAMLFNKTSKGKHVFGWLARKIPVVSNMVIKSECATFCRTLSLLLGSGLTLTESLEMVAANMSNIYFQEAVLACRTMVSEGWTLNASLRDTALFPPMVYNLVGIGEETGDLQGMLLKTANYYDDEVEEATQALLGLLEPMITVFLGIMVALLVVAIYLPMLNMTKAYDQYL